MRMVEAAGIEPDAHGVPKGYDSGQLPDNSGQERSYLGHTQKVGAGTEAEKRTVPDAGGTERDVLSVQHTCNGKGAELPPDLAELARLWPDIPEGTRAAILTRAKAAVTGKASADADGWPREPTS